MLMETVFSRQSLQKMTKEVDFHLRETFVYCFFSLHFLQSFEPQQEQEKLTCVLSFGQPQDGAKGFLLRDPPRLWIVVTQCQPFWSTNPAEQEQQQQQPQLQSMVEPVELLPMTLSL